MNLSSPLQPTSTHDSARQGGLTKKPKTVRRHGACNPCKASKTKECDGAEPCGACRSEKRKSRICEYSEKAKGIAAAREEGELLKRKHRQSTSVASDGESDEQEPQPQVQPYGLSATSTREPAVSMHKRISLWGVVDEFIQVKDMRGRAASNIGQIRDKWNELRKNSSLHDGPEIPPQRLVPDENISSAIKQGDASKARSMIELWENYLEATLRSIDNGNLQGAWHSIPVLVRAMDVWEMYARDTRHHPPTDDVLEKLSPIYFRAVEIDYLLGLCLGVQPINSKLFSSTFEHQRSQDDHRHSKRQLFSTIKRILDIDLLHEQGVWEFLNFVNEVKSASPATTLEKMATCITEKEPAAQQALKLTSNLVFVIMHCRSATACAHYSRDDCILPPDRSGPSDIIKTLKLNLPRQKGNECSQAIKHAGNALEAFEKLCEIDPEVTAGCWFRLHGALIAAVLLTVNGLREKTVNWDDTRERIGKVKGLFMQLKKINPSNAILDQAIRVLQACDQGKNTTSGASRAKTVPTFHHRTSDSPSDDSNSDSKFSPSKDSVRGRPSTSKRKCSFDLGIESMVSPTQPKKRRRENRDLPETARPTSLIDTHIQQNSDPVAFSMAQPFYDQETYDYPPGPEIDPNISFTSSTHAPFADGTSRPTTFGTMQHGPLRSDVPFDDTVQVHLVHPPQVWDDDALFYHMPAYSTMQELSGNIAAPHMAAAYDAFNNALTQSNLQVGQAPPELQTMPPGMQGLGNMMHSNQIVMASASEGSTFFNTTAKNYQSHKLEAASVESQARPSYALQAVPGQGQHEAIRVVPSETPWDCLTERGVVSAQQTPYLPNTMAPNLMRRASEPAWSHPDNYSLQAHSNPLQNTGSIGRYLEVSGS